ncbi:Hyphal wall protein [Candida albicans]
MRSILPISVLVTTALSASMSTIRSTTISSLSSCSSSSSTEPSSSALPVAPNLSSACYQNTTIQTIQPNSASNDISSIISSDSEAPETRYEYETDTDYTHVTKTVCDANNNCYVTVESESLTTYTTTIDGVLTVITTAVSASAAATATAESTIASTSTSSGATVASPISTKAAIKSSSSSITSKPQETQYEYETDVDVSHVIKTVCDSDNKCYLTTEVQSSTTYTTTIDGVLTVITTAVPISKTETSSPSVITSSAAAAVTEESTETEVLTTVITVTSCSDNKCASTVFTSGYSVYTVDETAYTTYFPVTTITSKLSSASINGEATNTKVAATTKATATASASTSVATSGTPQETETKISTAIVTITSCSNNKCHEQTKTTGIKVYTSEETVYTTYCPLSSTSEQKITSSVVVSVETPKSNPSNPSSSPIVEKSSSLEATSSNTATTSTSTTTSIPPVTINVISGNIVTETPVVDQIQSTSTHNPQKSTIAISTYEGVGATIIISNVTGFLSLVISLIFFMI